MSLSGTESKIIQRRRVLMTGVAAGLSPLFISGAKAAAPVDADGPIEFGDGLANMTAVFKMLTTFGDTAVYGGLTGIFYALIGDDMIPMFGYAGYRLHQSRVTKSADGTRVLETRGKEAGLYTDLASGKKIDTWKNPWTSEQVQMPPWLIPARCSVVRTEVPEGNVQVHDFGTQSYGGLLAKQSSGSALLQPAKVAWKKVGDRYLTSTDNSVRFVNPVTPAGWPLASTGEFVTENEMMKTTTSVKAIDDASTPHAPFTGVLTRDVPWFPFLRMGQSGISGRMVGLLQIYKITGKITDVPVPMRNYLEREYPEMLEPMTSWEHTVNKPGGTWQFYARTTPPETAGYQAPL